MSGEKIVDLVMLTYNRLEYTQMTLESMMTVDCGIPWDRVNFCIVDNASTDDTRQYIDEFKAQTRFIDQIYRSPKNTGVVGGFAYFRFNMLSGARYLGKVDNDSIFHADWLKNLINALDAFPKLGVVGAQSQGLAAAVLDPAGDNAVKRGNVGYFPARFVGGRFLARANIFHTRPMPSRGKIFGWTAYQQKLKCSIGWCYPPALIEHVGDKHSMHPKAIKNDTYARYRKEVRS